INGRKIRFTREQVFALYRLLNVIGHIFDNLTLRSTPFMSFLTNIFDLAQGWDHLCPITVKLKKMTTLLLCIEIYLEVFIHFTRLMVKNYFKAFSWFIFDMIAVVIYAFIFSVIAGFAFD